MATKLQNYIQLAGQTAALLTKTPKKWVGFLNTASRVYRYPFPDQLMIHAQRSKATLPASCRGCLIQKSALYTAAKTCYNQGKERQERKQKSTI